MLVLAISLSGMEPSKLHTSYILGENSEMLLPILPLNGPKRLGLLKDAYFPPGTMLPFMGDIPYLTPNPPMDTDGRREDTGRGVRKLTEAMVRARIRVDGRLEAVAGAFGGADGGLQWLW